MGRSKVILLRFLKKLDPTNHCRRCGERKNNPSNLCYKCNEKFQKYMKDHPINLTSDFEEGLRQAEKRFKDFIEEA